MTTSTSKASQGNKPTPPIFGQFSNSKASTLLEKANPGVRRSTPDSEALASSDEEADQRQRNPPLGRAMSNTSAPKPTRRTSWLSEVPTGPQRKSSLTASGSFSPASSHPTTPSGDQTSWAPQNASPGLSSGIGWSHGAPASFPWGSGIWNSEARKDPPARLQEVLQSPTTSSSVSQHHIHEDMQGSPISSRMPVGESAIPFAIPLHPTPKTYRSQSYSVGQMETELNSAVPPKSSGGYPTSRGRGGGQFAGLQHRVSRPSMLGDLGHDPATLGRVREDEDDGESANGSEESPWSPTQGRTYQELLMENAMLRQVASNPAENPRFRDRTTSSASAVSAYSTATGPLRSSRRYHGTVPEETDLAIEDLDELSEIPGYSSRTNGGRRYSEQSTNLDKQFTSLGLLENRNLESVKKAHWQTSLGFGGIPEAPQSRRHSFADIPTRHGSISSVGEPQSGSAAMNSRSGPHDREAGYGKYPEGPLNASQGDNTSYFASPDPSMRNEGPPSAGLQTSLHQAYVMPNSYGRSQHAHANANQPRENQLLFVVTFKCQRADVFYVQEDTGLQIKQGDVVIVEADRGTDLGTVAHANVSWSRAREWKEYYAEEHYKNLMMFARQTLNGGPYAVNPNGLSTLNGAPGSAVGGMGPPGQHNQQESQTGEIKPKLIKRLAQTHEIQTLRDKEGNEAKAKRVCQQKVQEHRLNMEILDAEFQMDWKKLTFYYFADAYINFNSLVTDLFKIYKTRIWMSAINPASFVTPSAGLQPPNVIGPGSIGAERDSPSERRRQAEYKSYGVGQPQTSPSSFGDSADAQFQGLRSPFANPYPNFGPGMRHPGLGLAGFNPGLQSPNDPFSTYTPSAYSIMEPGLQDYNTSPSSGVDDPRRVHPTNPDWTGNFQGLSLGS